MTQTGFVLSRAGGRYEVLSGNERVEASLRGRMKQDEERVLVGDEVELGRQDDGALTIERILPRRSLLRRRNPGRSRGVREIAANLDQVLVVGAAVSPDWSPQLMDRFIVVGEANDLRVIIVINKIDLVQPEPAAEELAAPYRSIGYEVHLTCAASGRGIAGLRESVAGHTSLVMGPTGVGKSSLLNALEPGLSLRTGAVSHRSRAGRHTTVSAEMHPLAGGGFVVDTPGLRDIGLWGMDPLDVRHSFPEIARASAGCRFPDCRHLTEPGCAVRDETGAGRVSATRLDSFHTLLKEAEEAARW